MKKIRMLTIMFLVFFSSQSNLSAMENNEQINRKLFNASRDGHIDVIELLLNRCINPNQQDYGGWTPLMLATLNRHTDIVQLLLENGADPNQQDNIGWTPLILAAVYGHVNVARLLLDRGANPNQQAHDGNTPLILAARYGHINIVHFFLKIGANPDEPNKHGNTPIIFAALNGYINIVQLLLKKGAVANQVNENGDTPLLHAVSKNHINVVRLLLEKGADPSQQSNNGNTATIRARNDRIIEENETIVSWYLKNNPYSMSFLNLFESEEFTDVGLPYNLRAHTTILGARIPNFTIDSLRTALEDSTEEQSIQFLKWIYTGLTENPENIKEVCDRLKIDFDFVNSIPAFRRDLQTLYNSRNTTGDFTIIVDGTNILAHKTILATRSNMFRSLFLGARNTSNEIRDRSGLSLPAFNAIIEFIYTGQISNLTQKISNELLEEMAALFFQLPEGELEEYLEQFLEQVI